jgi:peptidoglycan/xylan/chitin deacetylase (PgdA/CDA1 family)
MHEKGLDIQCHTKTHRDLNMIMNHESYRDYFLVLKEELEHSTRTIQKRLGFIPEFLAYPYGETNSLVIAMLEKMGYQGALTVERGANPFDRHPFRLKRSMIYGSFDLADFKDNLSTFQPFPRPALPGAAGKTDE